MEALRVNKTRSSTPSRPPFAISSSRGFAEFLYSHAIALAFTTYQTGKLFFIGVNDRGSLSVFDRTFERAMGLTGDAQTLYLATLYQIWRMDNVLQTGENSTDGYDRLFIPQLGYTTGDLDVHDMGIDSQGNCLFISTRFSCLARVSDNWNFEPIWTPPFISRLAGEDRCHLNGLAMHEGQPRYATACAQSDIADGWRDRRSDGGCVIDIATNNVIATGLSMPHSPRLYRDRLWLLNSGQGEFGYITPNTGEFTPMTLCPGYARGLAFVGDYAIVGLSRPRYEPTFTGLPLGEKLAEKNAEARCGLLVIELTTGDIVQWLRLENTVHELYDVVTLPGSRRPKAFGFKSDEIRTRVWADPQAMLRLS